MKNELKTTTNESTEEQAFQLAQRKAKVYASSSLVPELYRGNVANVMIAMNMAHRLGADVLMVMQNLYVVHGSPGWSAKFLVATFNQTRRFSTIGYEFAGKEGTLQYGCRAVVTERETGTVHKGTFVSLQMAKDEGWSTKKGSKWLTMADQMLRYRSATFLIRGIAPEISMGLRTVDEIEDMTLDATARTSDIKARLSQSTVELLEEAASEAVVSQPVSNTSFMAYTMDLDKAETQEDAIEILEAVKQDEDLSQEQVVELFDLADKLFA